MGLFKKPKGPSQAQIEADRRKREEESRRKEEEKQAQALRKVQDAESRRRRVAAGLRDIGQAEVGRKTLLGE